MDLMMALLRENEHVPPLEGHTALGVSWAPVVHCGYRLRTPE